MVHSLAFSGLLFALASAWNPDPCDRPALPVEVRVGERLAIMDASLRLPGVTGESLLVASTNSMSLVQPEPGSSPLPIRIHRCVTSHVALRDVAAGDTVRVSRDLEARTLLVQGASTPSLPEISVASTFIPYGTTVQPRHLRRVHTVARGEEVVVASSQASVTSSRKGRALTGGSMGDVILVRVGSTTLRAMVMENHSLHLVP